MTKLTFKPLEHLGRGYTVTQSSHSAQCNDMYENLCADIEIRVLKNIQKNLSTPLLLKGK